MSCSKWDVIRNFSTFDILDPIPPFENVPDLNYFALNSFIMQTFNF